MVSFGEHARRMTTATTAVLIAVVTLAACSAGETSEPSEQLEPAPTAEPAFSDGPTPSATPQNNQATALPTGIPEPSPTPFPNELPGLVGGPPSQSDADAQRDGVLSEVAFLSFADRVDIQAELEVGGQRWVISRFPMATWPVLPSLGVWSGSVDSGSSELLQLDGETIVKAVPMVSAPATWITAIDATIYAGRQGDGGYPDSTVVRFDTETADLDRLRMPWSFERERVAFSSNQWDMVVPSSAEPLLNAMVPLVNGDATPDSVAALDQAIDTAVIFDPFELPDLALSRSRCDVADATYFFDFGTHCVVEEGSRASGDSTVVISGERVTGLLVGAGWMSSVGPTYAAIIDTSDGLREESPLLFVDIHDPTVIWDTGLAGQGPAFGIQQVSFFEGGFVTTAAVDLATSVQAYDQDAEPLTSFISPTDRDLGYPPDPEVNHVAATPDGSRIVYAEREWPLDGTGLPGQDLAIVLAESGSGRQVRRVELSLRRNEKVLWIDTDDRWVTVSFSAFAPPGDDVVLAPRSIMMDLTTSEVFPLGFEQPALVTLEQQTAPDEPRLRLMTPGPYRHGQTVTVRAIPRPLIIQEGEPQSDWIRTVRLCAGPATVGECSDLPIARRSEPFEIPTEVDVVLTELVGHRTLGDIEADTTYDCLRGGCTLAGLPIEFVAEAAPPKPTILVAIDDQLASLTVESALFSQAEVGICFLRDSASEQQHRNTTARVPFCTDFAFVDFVEGAASLTLDLPGYLADACSIDECSVRMFYVDRG